MLLAMSRPFLLPFLLALAPLAACSDRQPSEAAARSAAPAPRIEAGQARALVAAGGILVDVREAGELAETGRLQSALHLPLPAIKAQAATGKVPPELAAFSGKPVILYCRSGRRSGEAAAILRELGLADVRNLGGFEDAVRAGFPVEAGAGAD